MRNSESSSDRAYRIIRAKIVTLEYAPNTPISELHLADNLNVSRTPIREALLKLSREGLVDDRSRAGTIVSPIRLDAVKASHFVREKLEVAIIREAANKHSNYFKFTMGQAIDEQEFAIKENDTELFFSSDEKMHRSFAEVAGQPTVWPVIAESKKHLDRLRWLGLESKDLKILLADHIELLEAIKNYNSDLAERAMIKHLYRVIKKIDELVVKFPNFFELEHDYSDGV